MQDIDRALLHSLMLKGQARADVLSQAIGTSASGASEGLDRLSADGLCEQTKLGWRLTAAGCERVEEALRAERSTVGHVGAAALYEEFLPLNVDFKQITFDWQMRSSNGQSVPNDHTDLAYDEGVIARLAAAHEVLRAFLGRVAVLLPRFQAYEKRFDAALTKLRSGERRYFAAPLIDSYHTVWFELHEDLIRLAGRTRSQEAAAGHGA